MDAGQVIISPGESVRVDFKASIDFFCKAFLTPENYPINAKEVDVTKTGMTIICGKIPGYRYSQEKVKLNWLVFGLNNLQTLPTWRTQFYSAISNAENGLYKASLFDYAVSFEAFLEEFIRVKLAQRYDAELAEFLLSSNHKVEERCKRLLKLASGKKLSDRDDVYQPWDTNVRQIRNKLFHGENIVVTLAMTELAHSAVYQAIRFVERECV